MLPSIENERTTYYICISMDWDALEENAEKFEFKIKLIDDYNLVAFDWKKWKMFETFWTKDMQSIIMMMIEWILNLE